MNKIQAKSPCCRGKVVRFGERRRRCQVCGKTWRKRSKKRGRKVKRTTIDLCLRYLKHALPSMWAKAQEGGASERLLQIRLRRSRDLFLHQTTWPEIPAGDGPLLAIVDAMIFKWRGYFHTCYLILIKRPEDKEAVITPSWVAYGAETQTGWQQALDRLPDDTRARIRAVVCDGHRGPVNYAKRHKWLIQRCHFHLLSYIQGRRSRSKDSLHREEGIRVYKLVERCLTAADEAEAERLRDQVETEALNTLSKGLRKGLRGFVHFYEDFRMYRYHPELYLPTTTNAAESLNACVKGLQYRARGFATLESFKKWLDALLKFKQKVTCNGHKHTPN